MKPKKTKSAGGVVLNKKRQVLIAGHRDGAWTLPKGHIEKGEKEIEAARREIKEETGITQLKFIKKLGNIVRYQISLDGKGENKSIIKNIIIFLFETDQEKLQPQDPENPKARWVDKNKMVDLLTHP